MVKLDRIAEEAGSLAGSNTIEGTDEGALTLAEISRVRGLVLGMGASRTLGTHVHHWERLRDWTKSKGLNVYSMDSSVVLRYLLDLDERWCGPTVITSVRMAVN